MLQANGRSSEAESWFRRALADAEGIPSDTEKGLASAVASAANNLAMLLRSRGKGAEAEGLLRRAAQGFAKEHQAAELRPGRPGLRFCETTNVLTGHWGTLQTL